MNMKGALLLIAVISFQTVAAQKKDSSDMREYYLPSDQIELPMIIGTMQCDTTREAPVNWGWVDPNLVSLSEGDSCLLNFKLSDSKFHYSYDGQKVLSTLHNVSVDNYRVDLEPGEYIAAYWFEMLPPYYELIAEDGLYKVIEVQWEFDSPKKGRILLKQSLTFRLQEQ